MFSQVEPGEQLKHDKNLHFTVDFGQAIIGFNNEDPNIWPSQHNLLKLTIKATKAKQKKR